MTAVSQRTRPDAVGSSVWPAGLTGWAVLYPAARRAYAVCLAPLIGALHVGSLRLAPGSVGAFPLDATADGLPLLYELQNPADAGRVVFVTE
jgi:hypothetical protein